MHEVSIVRDIIQNLEAHAQEHIIFVNLDELKKMIQDQNDEELHGW